MERKTPARRRLSVLDYALMVAIALAFGLGAASALSSQAHRAAQATIAAEADGPNQG